MALHLVLTFHLLDRTFHGRNEGGRPEWPPSPLRVFQALVAAYGALSRRHHLPDLESALRWFEALPPPTIFAPGCVVGKPFGIAVPNNDLDIVAADWVRRRAPRRTPSELKTIKTVHPIHVLDPLPITFDWVLSDPIPPEVRRLAQSVCDLARYVVSLGWGWDLVGASGHLRDEERGDWPGERWDPGFRGSEAGLRVPVAGTFNDLVRRHGEFRNRLRGRVYVQPSPVTMFDRFFYRRSTDPVSRSVAAFSILKPDASGFRPFDTVRRALTVAGMVRHATARAARSTARPSDWIASFVLGHGGDGGRKDHVPVGNGRFAYLPIPSIEQRGDGSKKVGDVRRVILTTFADGTDESIAWARHVLSGADLQSENAQKVEAVLSLIPESDPVIRQYIGSAARWVTVTPVVLPGFDDPRHLRRRLKSATDARERQHLLLRLDERIDALIRKAIVQAGYAKDLARHARIGWRKTGFVAGVETADRYGVPDHLRRFPRYHVRIEWLDASGNLVKMPGPLCIGGGRFYGVGLFIQEPD